MIDITDGCEDFTLTQKHFNTPSYAEQRESKAERGTIRRRYYCVNDCPSGEGEIRWHKVEIEVDDNAMRVSVKLDDGE